MASLDPGKVSHLRSCLAVCKEPILLAAVQSCDQPAKEVCGALGVIDWRLHGAVSKLLNQSAVQKFALIPSNRLLGKASLLLMRMNDPSQVNELAATLKKMQLERICIAQSTIPPHLQSNVDQQLKKANVTWSNLEELV